MKPTCRFCGRPLRSPAAVRDGFGRKCGLKHNADSRVEKALRVARALERQGNRPLFGDSLLEVAS